MSRISQRWWVIKPAGRVEARCGGGVGAAWAVGVGGRVSELRMSAGVARAREVLFTGRHRQHLQGQLPERVTERELRGRSLLEGRIGGVGGLAVEELSVAEEIRVILAVDSGPPCLRI